VLLTKLQVDTPFVGHITSILQSAHSSGGYAIIERFIIAQERHPLLDTPVLKRQDTQFLTCVPAQV
jgi:hypothetical protein